MFRLFFDFAITLRHDVGIYAPLAAILLHIDVSLLFRWCWYYFIFAFVSSSIYHFASLIAADWLPPMLLWFLSDYGGAFIFIFDMRALFVYAQTALMLGLISLYFAMRILLFIICHAAADFDACCHFRRYFFTIAAALIDYFLHIFAASPDAIIFVIANISSFLRLLSQLIIYLPLSWCWCLIIWCRFFSPFFAAFFDFAAFFSFSSLICCRFSRCRASIFRCRRLIADIFFAFIFFVSFSAIYWWLIIFAAFHWCRAIHGWYCAAIFLLFSRTRYFFAFSLMIFDGAAADADSAFWYAPPVFIFAMSRLPISFSRYLLCRFHISFFCATIMIMLAFDTLAIFFLLLLSVLRWHYRSSLFRVFLRFRFLCWFSAAFIYFADDAMMISSSFSIFSFIDWCFWCCCFCRCRWFFSWYCACLMRRHPLMLEFHAFVFIIFFMAFHYWFLHAPASLRVD